MSSDATFEVQSDNDNELFIESSPPDGAFAEQSLPSVDSITGHMKRNFITLWADPRLSEREVLDGQPQDGWSSIGGWIIGPQIPANSPNLAELLSQPYGRRAPRGLLVSDGYVNTLRPGQTVTLPDGRSIEPYRAVIVPKKSDLLSMIQSEWRTVGVEWYEREAQSTTSDTVLQSSHTNSSNLSTKGPSVTCYKDTLLLSRQSDRLALNLKRVSNLSANSTPSSFTIYTEGWDTNEALKDGESGCHGFFLQYDSLPTPSSGVSAIFERFIPDKKVEKKSPRSDAVMAYEGYKNTPAPSHQDSKGMVLMSTDPADEMEE